MRKMTSDGPTVKCQEGHRYYPCEWGHRWWEGFGLAWPTITWYLLWNSMSRWPIPRWKVFNSIYQTTPSISSDDFQKKTVWLRCSSSTWYSLFPWSEISLFFYDEHPDLTQQIIKGAQARCSREKFLFQWYYYISLLIYIYIHLYLHIICIYIFTYVYIYLHIIYIYNHTYMFIYMHTQI